MDTNNGLPTPKCTSRTFRNSPLPQLNWGDPNEIWDSMLTRDHSYNRDAFLLIKNPLITAKMRSILLDWLSEVCEVFNLLRETYYFALDFIDRYLSIKNDIARQQLQLIGITCLFIAAKIEEVYPPKLKELAFVTDGACTELEIIQKELVIMETLNWSLHPVTVNKWLSIYMQLYSIIEKENRSSLEERATGDQFLNPNYSTTFFFQIAHLVDLSMLDIGSIRFDYDMIAASAFYHFTSDETVYTCTSKLLRLFCLLA
jgi:G1/S-specific cyclin-E